MNSEIIIQELDQLANRIELRGVKVFYPIIKMQGKGVSAFVRKNGIDHALLALPSLIDQKQMHDGMISFYQYGGVLSAKWQYGKFYTGYKSLGGNINRWLKAWIQDMQMYVYSSLGEMIQNINETTLKTIRNVIDEAQANGYGREKTARMITEITDGEIGKRRALVIARTEGTRAASKGHKLASDAWKSETGSTNYKKWVPIIDNRTRPDHREMNDTPPIPEEMKFNVGGNPMDAPGDPNAPAEETIACRCRAVYLTDRMLNKI